MLIGVCAVVFAASAASAYAAITYYYWPNISTAPGNGGGDTTILYRNFNDSCRSDFAIPLPYSFTESIYSLSNGSWVVTYTNQNNCSGSPSQAHLGPSSDYGYTYVQSKCRNAGTKTFTLDCWTTQPS